MKIWGWGGWRIGIGGWLVVAALGGGAAHPLAAQVPTTTVQDTVTDASGAGAAGTVVVSWAAFTTTAGSSVAAGSLSSTLGTGGALSVPLQPNADATPMGSYYTAVFHLSDGTTSREFWVVPLTATGTVTLASIRNQVLPTSVAMQTVSKQYVDTTVAKAMAGVGPGTGLGGAVPYVLKSGDTITGPLVLPGDPVSAMQAADKHYVDAAVAGAGGGGGPVSIAGVNAAVNASGCEFSSTGINSVSMGSCNLGSTTALGSAAFSTILLQPNVDPTTNGDVISLLAPGGSRYALQGALAGLHSGVSSALGGWYGGMGILSGTAYGTASPLFGINASNQTSGAYGLGKNLFNIEANGYVSTYNNVLDDGSGNGLVAGTWSATGYVEMLTTPASSSATCRAGQFTDDANFHYVCVGTNAWKRVALAAF